MARLREIADADPSLALELVGEGRRRFALGRYEDERAYLGMRALVDLGKIAQAREEASAFFEHHPDSPFAERVHRLTGVHPPPRSPRRP
ncbi:MAG TPA: hypothetical protein VF316_24550 [Polyangiaceae bacterium]